MKTSIKAFIACFSMMLLLTACAEAPEGQKVEAKDAVEAENTASTPSGIAYTVDAETSQVNWVGSKPTGQHQGFVKLKSGELLVKDDALVGGSFELDMASITNLDLPAGDGKEKLEGHLKTGDFFEVEKFPTATFTITKVEAASDTPDATHKITGNLTMKGITKSVELPAKVEMTENGLMAKTPKFTINRTEWSVNFKSGILGVPKDKAIHDEIGLQIDLAAAPQATTM